MAKSSNPKRKKVLKTVLKLPDLEQSKSAVLNSLVSSSSQRSCDHAIREFIEWYCSEPRLALNKTVVTGYRIALCATKQEANWSRSNSCLTTFRYKPQSVTWDANNVFAMR
jgi:hypothetical protein